MTASGPQVLFERVVTTRDDAVAGARGAHRLELCERLDVEGLTPGLELVRDVLRAVTIPVHVLIRARAGDDFGASAEELARMREDLLARKALGAHGFVFGCLDRNRDLDLAATRTLLAAARPAAVTFHRAFDRVRDPARALEQLIDLGVERVLTAGGAPTAWAGRTALRALVTQARDRITVLAGGGVRQDHWRALVRATGVRELHASQPIDLLA